MQGRRPEGGYTGALDKPGIIPTSDVSWVARRVCSSVVFVVTTTQNSTRPVLPSSVERSHGSQSVRAPHLVEPIKMPSQDPLTHGRRSSLRTLRAGSKSVRPAGLAARSDGRAGATGYGRRVGWYAVRARLDWRYGWLQTEKKLECIRIRERDYQIVGCG